MYYDRLADKELKFRLSAYGATLIVGQKWCGKTTTASRQANSILDLEDPDRRFVSWRYVECISGLVLQNISK